MLFLADAAVFRSGLYFLIVEPNSAPGLYERVIRLERKLQRDGRKRILIVGDSRSEAIRPQLAEEWARTWGMTFGNAAVKGTTPRAWYYVLRELDPGSTRYDAIVIGLDDYDDNNDYSRGESTSEVETPVSSLRVSDVFDYPWTFKDRNYRRDAFLECLLKGSAYKVDFQELMSHPWARWRSAKKTRHDYGWFVSHYVGADWSLSGVTVDWETRQITFPESADETTREVLLRRVQSPPEAEDGWKAEMRRQWLGRIAKRYRGSRTRLVFVRLPSSPIPFPQARKPTPLRGVVRDLASQQSNIILLDEHLFDYLERPENFYDYTHMNAAGARVITEALTYQLRLILHGMSRQ